MKLSRRNLFKRTAEVAGVAAGAVVATAIPTKVLEAFESPVVPDGMPLVTYRSRTFRSWNKRYVVAHYRLKDTVPYEYKITWEDADGNEVAAPNLT